MKLTLNPHLTIPANGGLIKKDVHETEAPFAVLYRKLHGRNPQKPPEPVRYDRVGSLGGCRQQRRAAGRSEAQKARSLAWANQYVKNLYNVDQMKKRAKAQNV